MGNPANLIDLDGERPSANEAALMAAYVYLDDNQETYLEQLKETGWEISSSQEGTQSVLFQRTVDGVTEYACAYAGTKSLDDAVNDITQLVGLSSQYETAVSYAGALSDELGDSELTFVGHSLGGGKSIASSMATGRPAITFNSAAVSILTKITERLDKTPDVVNYRAIGKRIGNINFGIAKLYIFIGGDVLNNAQQKVGLTLPGKMIMINTGIKPTHGISDFLKINLPEP